MSGIRQSFDNFCQNCLTTYLNGKQSPKEFIHFYWYSLKPLAENYNFPIPDAIQQHIDHIQNNWNNF